MSEPSSAVSTTDAISAMRQRGIDDPESLVSATSAERIIQTCNHADKQGWAKNLLVWKIKQGGIDTLPSPTSKREMLRARFDAFAENYVAGDIPESHARFQARQHPEDDRCEGMMVLVDDPAWPFVDVQCDACGFQASYPARSLALLPPRPPTNPRPVPGPRAMVPEHQHRVKGGN